MKLTTTLNKIRNCSPCASGWRKLLSHLGANFNPDSEINLLTILESNGVTDMLWAIRATEQDSKRIAAQLAIEFAEQALQVFEKRHPDDPRPRNAIQAARDYLDGEIDLETLRKARAAAAAASSSAAYSAAPSAATAASAAAASAAADADAAAAADAADAAFAAAAAFGFAAAAAFGFAAAFASAAAASERENARQKQAEIIRRILE